MGCQQGQAAENGVAILDFGRPATQQGSNGQPIYGSIVFNDIFVPISDIEQASEMFLFGYYNCSPLGTFLTLGVGTNNCAPTCTVTGGDVTYNHGQQWAQMVYRIAQWINTNSYGSQVWVQGANDIESSWNSPAATRSWADGFASLALFFYYHYGSCDGCPTNGDLAENQVPPMPNNWTRADIWYVAYGNTAALPIPEIYVETSVNAQ